MTGFVLRITLQESEVLDSKKTVGFGDVLGVEFSDLIPGTNYTVYLLVEVEGQSDTTVDTLDVTTCKYMYTIVFGVVVPEVLGSCFLKKFINNKS